MKGTVIAHSVVIATVVAFGTVVGLDIYNGVPTLGGNQMYLTKVVMFLAAWWVPFMTLLEVQRQGRETRRMIVDMQNLSWQFRRGNLYGGEV